jgi:hypothetical protein
MLAMAALTTLGRAECREAWVFRRAQGPGSTIRRAQRMTTPRPRAFRVSTFPGRPGATDQPSAAP